VLIGIVAFILLQEPPLPPSPEPPQTSSPSLLDPLTGTIRVQYRYRATSDASDSDLYEIISLAYGNLEKDPVTAVLTARLAEDLDGNKHVNGFYPFTSTDDRYAKWSTERLYTAYLDFKPRESSVQIRAGRQTLDEFPECVPMDGARVRVLAGSQIALAAFGGIPVNLFESSPSGDAMYGASVDWLPVPEGRGRYRVEYLHLRDENVFGLHRDDLVGFVMEEGAGDFSFHARYTLLEGESRDLVARLTGAVPDAEFLFQLQGTYVFHQIEVLSYAIDPYASFMMDLQPYCDVEARASKGFGSVFTLDALFTSRQFVRSGVETTYNHEFKRFELAPVLRNWPLNDVTLRVAWDYWNSSGEGFWTLSGDISWSLQRDIVLFLGSSYALYSVDAFTGEEHDRVRTYSAALKWKVSKTSSIDARFSYEENAVGNFRTLEIGFRHAF
jgi:hypothetical protein